MTTLNLVEGGEEIAESKMTIFDIEYRDLTGYTCKATNDAGVATKSLTINYNGELGKLPWRSLPWVPIPGIDVWLYSLKLSMKQLNKCFVLCEVLVGTIM